MLSIPLENLTTAKVTFQQAWLLDLVKLYIMYDQTEETFG